MCTAATYKTKDFYFGRTLDYEFSYGDEVTITPRNYVFNFREKEKIETHYAIIGMAYVTENYPLYYDAINEKGLGMAGLNFVGNAYYREKVSGKDNIAQFEFIPWILSQCASVAEAKQLIEKINLTNVQFNEKLPLAQLHWIISDSNESITVESVKEGIKVYPNPVGVLTNNPPFNQQMFELNKYMQLSSKSPENRFSEELNLEKYSSEILMISSTVSSGVLTPAITSTNFILSAGLKKCIPIIGRVRPFPISVIESDDVFEAKIHSGLQILSNSPNVVFLTSMFSNAA